MAGGTVPLKTAEGQAELDTRERRMSQRHRTVLLLVDGRRSEAEVRALAAQAGASPACFDELIASGLIALRPAAARKAQRPQGAPPSAPMPMEDSLLPSVRSLPPDSLHDSVLGGRPPPDSWLPPEDGEEEAVIDETLEQARELLVRMVRQEAPLAGTITVLRLRRARSRSEMTALLDEVEAKLGKRRSLALEQTLASVRRLLQRGADATRSAA
jgi:hypothetical protein